VLSALGRSEEARADFKEARAVLVRSSRRA
jgi:hypothetical protein